MSTPQLIGSREAAEILGLSRATLNRRVHSGAIKPAGKIAAVTGGWMFDSAEIERLAQDDPKGELHKDDPARYQKGQDRGAA